MSMLVQRPRFGVLIEVPQDSGNSVGETSAGGASAGNPEQRIHLFMEGYQDSLAMAEALNAAVGPGDAFILSANEDATKTGKDRYQFQVTQVFDAEKGEALNQKTPLAPATLSILLGKMFDPEEITIQDMSAEHMDRIKTAFLKLSGMLKSTLGMTSDMPIKEKIQTVLGEVLEIQPPLMESIGDTQGAQGIREGLGAILKILGNNPGHFNTPTGKHFLNSHLGLIGAILGSMQQKLPIPADKQFSPETLATLKELEVKVLMLSAEIEQEKVEIQ